MNFQELLKNKKIVIGLAIGLAVVILLGIVAVSSNKKDAATLSREKLEKPLKEDIKLLTTDNIGKAIEIQALLAREGIVAAREADGSKSSIVLKKGESNMGERDRALLAIVKSGLMDQNMGLEIFDKGDFTSTKEDKRIRLARAVNGELARLIRRIPPIENASVFVSIPEQTMFTSQQKPITATVQVTMPSGDKLDQTKVKAITNLLLGAVNGLEAKNITITDTNGTVYSSIINASDDMLARLEENDRYMENKVRAQLDRLVGKGNYVATVSTFLRQAPVEKSSIIYDPDLKTSVSEQTFSEGLGDQTRDTNKSINAVSVYLPNGLPGANADSAQDRSYSRTAKETQYGVTKTQVNEYMTAGVIEEISIAVTLEQAAIPENVTIEELKDLLAKAASPKVRAENVSIAFSDSIDPILAGDRPVTLPRPDETGNPWWLAIALLVIGLAVGLSIISKKVKATQEQQLQELESLRNKTQDQERQLRDVNLKAAELIERQSQLAQNLIEQQQMQAQLAQLATQPQAIPQQSQPMPQPQPQQAPISDALGELASDVEDVDDDEMVETLKSWIEKA